MELWLKYGLNLVGRQKSELILTFHFDSSLVFIHDVIMVLFVWVKAKHQPPTYCHLMLKYATLTMRMWVGQMMHICHYENMPM